MRRALELAREGLGRVSPNPAVGAVVVSRGEIVGEGSHESFGGPHAEVVALEAAGSRAKGATAYVSLEPCSHEGKTPPCTDAIMAAGVARVAYGSPDPDPGAAGGGDLLEEKGVKVARGVCEKEARDFYAYFFKHVRTGRPFVTAKWAMTLDGRLATRTGDSHWVTSATARERGRTLRAESDVVMVGVGTVLRDDPKLTARTGDGREPLRVVVDSDLKTPPGSELFSVAGAKTLLACTESADAERERLLNLRGAEVVRLPAIEGSVDLEALLAALHERGKLKLYVEGGRKLLGSLFDAKLVDEVRVFVAPKIVGGTKGAGAVAGEGVARMADALDITSARWETIGDEALLCGRVGDWDWMA
jgi:diaminohydroxyphosphoribosylaminopyrimidine deaminase/5-amino-6-(5-phosphoribosylamino)uracil reductase